MSHDRTLERAALLQDLLLLLLALGLTHLGREWLAVRVSALKPAPPGGYLYLLLVLLPTWALGAEQLELHRVGTLTGAPVELVRRLLWTQGWGAVAMALVLVAAQSPLNRSFIVAYLMVSTALLALSKVAQRLWVRRERGEALALVVGEADERLLLDIERLRGRRVERLSRPEGPPLRERLQAGGVDEVVLAPSLSRAAVGALLSECAEVGVPALMGVERVDADLVAPRAEVVGPTVYLVYQRHQPDRPALLVKAIVDRLGAAIGLVLLAPLLLLVAALVRLTSPGPALFIQQRGGLNGRPFAMLKFRTMRLGAEAERDALLAANEMDGPVFKISDDPRVTPLGRLLRRTSVDELPQLVNVLLGHMSLVGPRPLPVVETRELTGIHRRRLSMRPGITCLWQVSGRNRLGFADWMALDLQYVDRWSLGLDLAILLRTLPALISGRGAV